MLPLTLVAAGLIALAAGWLAMRGLGPGARIGRILAATPVLEMGRAIELAREGRPRYVGVGGRVDAEEPWEDEGGRPLVWLRRRLELRRDGRWTVLGEERRVVPFELSGALERVSVDGDALDEGVVVVARESVGTAADVPDRVPADTPAATPARLRVEFVSAVDHALVLGVPDLDATTGGVTMRPGLGRPLILTTLEPAEAMRLLAEGRQGATRVVAALLAGGVLLVGAGLVTAVADALG